MELIPTKTNIDFIRFRKAAYALSGVLALLGLLSLTFQGLNLGIDFSGGTLVQVRFTQPPSLEKIRVALSTMALGDVVIQEFGSAQEVLIRVEKQASGADAQSALAGRIIEVLKPLVADGIVESRRVEFVGPQVGSELAINGLLAILYSMVAILVYVAWRFEMRFAYGAILALLHDVLITVGLFSLMQREFTLVVVAALLTVIGYSINDTIVVYDRIREEIIRIKKQPLATAINRAINDTLSRTFITSLTVLFVLAALLLFGGAVIYDFALVLFCGVMIGTYSSIFVASPIVLLLERGPKEEQPKSVEEQP